MKNIKNAIFNSKQFIGLFIGLILILAGLPLIVKAQTFFLSTSAGNEMAESGEVIDYKIIYRNASNKNISNAALLLTLPEGANLQKFIASNQDIKSFMTSRTGESTNINALIIKLGSLTVNEEGKVIAKIRIDETVAENTVLSFPVQLTYNEPQITVMTNDSIKIVETKDRQGLIGGLGTLAGLGIPFWLIIFIIIIIAGSLICLKKFKTFSQTINTSTAITENKNHLKDYKNNNSNDNNFNGNGLMNGQKSEIAKPDLSSKDNK